jgi:hypothetical protein
MDEQLIALYHRHVATAFDRQLRMADFLGRKGEGGDWEYDTETGILTFSKLKFEAPLIGSHAEHNNSWLWAWSNKNLKLSFTNRALGTTVRAVVHRLGVHQLGAPGFSLEPLLGEELTEHAAHVLGIILSRELDYDAYYTFPYDNGTALLLIRDKRLAFTEKHPLRRVITIFPQVLSALPVFDHKAAFTNYAKDYGLTVTDVPGGVKATDGKDELTATFDDLGRLTQLEGTATPEEPKPATKVTKKKPAAKKTTKKPPAKKAAKKPAKPVKKSAKKAGKKR